MLQNSCSPTWPGKYRGKPEFNHKLQHPGTIPLRVIIHVVKLNWRCKQWARTVRTSSYQADFFLVLFCGIWHIYKLNIDPPGYTGSRFELIAVYSNFIIFAVTRTLVTGISCCWIIIESNLWFTLVLHCSLSYLSSWLPNF